MCSWSYEQSGGLLDKRVDFKNKFVYFYIGGYGLEGSSFVFHRLCDSTIGCLALVTGPYVIIVGIPTSEQMTITDENPRHAGPSG